MNYKPLPEIVISRKELKKLGEYSCSVPTGTRIGKRWRCDVNAFRRFPPGVEHPGPEWMIGEYYDIGSEIKVGIRWSWAVSEPGKVHKGEL